MISVRLEKLNEDGSYSTCLEYLVCSRNSLVSSVMMCCQAVAADGSGSYFLKVFDDRGNFYRDLHLNSHLQISDLRDFINSL